MNPSAADLATQLRQLLQLYREILALVERENSALRDANTPARLENTEARRQLLPRLDQAVAQLRQYRSAWSNLPQAERQRQPEVTSLLRQCQDTIMRVLMLDRENEQGLLRRGLLGPRNLPSHNLQRPHFVAHLYQRHGHPSR